jgi:aminoglycoside phosphotransferase family enzyme/predicted kinase
MRFTIGAMSEPSQQPVIQFLSETAFGGEAQRIDTHAASVFLAGDRAWKMKRAVAFSFLDFTTLEARERALRDELRLNRRTAPDLYLRVLPVTEAQGRLALDGEGKPVEWLLEMRRFEQEGLYSWLADRGALTVDMVDELARAVVRFHAEAEPRPDKGGHDGMATVVEGNRVDLARLAGNILPAAAVETTNRLSIEALERHHDLLERRRAEGLVRHCHGDLHLRNIVRIEGRPVLFDCIEFNEDFACIDVLYDLAFLLMDLIERGLPGHAHRVMQGYVERTDETEGLSLLPLFIGARGTIRAKVEGFAAQMKEDATARRRQAAVARGYLHLAHRALQPQPPRLIAIGGRSGTGKSSLAAALAPSLGALPGAVVLRSDVIRKRLFGREPTERLPPEAYKPEVSERVFATIAERARRLLAAGHSVIADAVYGHPEQRTAIEAVARQAHAPFTGIWLTAPEPVLEHRVGARVNDASDADARVVRLQRGIEKMWTRWRRLRVDRPLAEVAAEVRGIIEEQRTCAVDSASP